MSFDPQSPSDRADQERERAIVCEWCDDQIDEFDLNQSANVKAGGIICSGCFGVWFIQSSQHSPAQRAPVASRTHRTGGPQNV